MPLDMPNNDSAAYAINKDPYNIIDLDLQLKDVSSQPRAAKRELKFGADDGEKLERNEADREAGGTVEQQMDDDADIRFFTGETPGECLVALHICMFRFIR